MDNPLLSVREIQLQDTDSICDYWQNSDPSFLQGMGVDLAKVPSRDEFKKMLINQLDLNYKEKQSYCTIWEINGKAVGHSNVNKIRFGDEAFMHLHLWNKSTRSKGTGSALIKLSLPFFFENLKLKKLCFEPYALNLAPNKTLEKAGFTFIKEYVTTPGSINFEQPVFRWELTYDQFISLEAKRTA